jgi:CheY-like chemotaxis protein
MKVLIVDDGTVIRSIVKKLISGKFPDAEFYDAKDGDEAKSIINEDQFDAFTIDYNMPGANGEEVAMAAKERNPDAKICILPANKQQAIREKAESIGVKFLVKPHFQEELIAFLNE